MSQERPKGRGFWDDGSDTSRQRLTQVLSAVSPAPIVQSSVDAQPAPGAQQPVVAAQPAAEEPVRERSFAPTCG